MQNITLCMRMWCESEILQVRNFAWHRPDWSPKSGSCTPFGQSYSGHLWRFVVCNWSISSDARSVFSLL